MSLAQDLLATEQFSSTTSCYWQSEVATRIIRVIYDDPLSPLPCRVMYEKDGVEQELASARNTAGFCESTERQVIKNLSVAGWHCEHGFQGAVLEADPALSLDLSFEGHYTADALNTNQTSLAEERAIKSRLLNTFEQHHRLPLQEQLANELRLTLPDDLQLQVQLDATVTLVRMPDTASETGTEKAETKNLTTAPRFSSEPSNLAANAAVYALASAAMRDEQQAQNLAAELYRVHPLVASRVAMLGTERASVYRVLLGTAQSQEPLVDALQSLGESVRGLFDVIDASGQSEIMHYLPDDRTRYILAQCLSEGHREVDALARCSGYVVGVDVLMSCLAGGSCLPAKATRNDDYPAIDIVEAIDTDDPVEVARVHANKYVKQCESLSDPTGRESAECIAFLLLDDDQRFVIDCYEKDPVNEDLIACVGGERLANIVNQYSRCAASREVNQQCLLELTDNDFVSRSAACLESASNETIARCTVLANVDTSHDKSINCLQRFTNANLQLSCITSRHLTAEQATLLECSVGSPEIGVFTECAAGKLDIGSAGQWSAVGCLLEGSHSVMDVLNCAGGRFAAAELQACLATESLLADCLAVETILTDILQRQIARHFTLAGQSPHIAKFRQQLYAAQGGDLSELLSDSDNSWWQDSARSATEKGGLGPRTPSSGANPVERYGVDK